MKAIALALSLASVPALAACGGSPAPPASAVPPPAPVVRPANDGARILETAECKSLGQWLADGCLGRPNEHSARVEGWCGDLLRGVESGAWVTGDCAKHVTRIDSMCFRSATNVHDMMACDQSVARP